MDMIPVNSSIVKKIGFDQSDLTLRVELDTGRLYEYYRVPFVTYSRFLAADSKGAFFNLEIKGKFNAKEIRTIASPTANSGRQAFHDLLDRAMNEAAVGSSFLPGFVQLVLESGSQFA